MKKMILIISTILLGFSCSGDKPWKLDQGIYILDKNGPVESYEELVARIPRKAFYVDCWATWCAPCVEEFKYYDQLRGFLEEHSIEILYLNSEMGIDDSSWFSFIREHELQGYHVRLNWNLQRDLIDLKVYSPLIPQFMIMDSTGVILEKGALRPSDGIELQEQLLSILFSE